MPERIIEEVVFTDTVTADPEAKLNAHKHLDGCPKNRVEKYGATSPADQGSVAFEVTHCLDCGQLDYKRKG